jgi:methoxymalonate biosynthesis acyl carrier protein
MIDMDLEAILENLREFIRKHFKISDQDPDFSDHIHLFDYGYVDSFGAVELNTYVQEAFGIKIKPADLVAFSLNTIHEIATFVAQRRKGETCLP